MEQLTAPGGLPLLRMLAISRIDAQDVPEPGDVDELTQSVRRHGVLQPLLVRPRDGRFSLVAGRRRLAAAREAGLREVPCLVYTLDDEEAAQVAEAANAHVADVRAMKVDATADVVAQTAGCDAACTAALSELRDALGSVRACIAWLPREGATTRERVAQRLLAADLERAEWLVRSRQYLTGSLRVTPRPLSAAAFVGDVRRGARAMALHGGAMDVIGPAEDIVINVDKALMTAAVRGLAWGLLAFGELAGDRRVRVTVARRPNGRVAIEVCQPSTTLTPVALTRFFDRDWTDRPGGTVAELGVLLARYASAAHGAPLEVSSAPGSGTTVTVTLG